MVQDIKEDSIGCILFGKDTGIRENTKVVRTKKKAGIPVGDGFVGRIIDPLGAPIDGKGEIKEDDYRPVNRKHRALSKENQFQCRWKQVFCL